MLTNVEVLLTGRNNGFDILALTGMERWDIKWETAGRLLLHKNCDTVREFEYIDALFIHRNDVGGIDCVQY